MSFETENARAKTEEIRQLKDLFSLYDNDASGTINKIELKIRDQCTTWFAHWSDPLDSNTNRFWVVDPCLRF